MALSLSHQFGQRSAARPAGRMPATEDRPKAEFWLNVGYVSEHKDDDGNYRFVALAQGIPLDQIEALPTNSKNVNFAYFRQAQNGLRDDLLTEAKKLKPGEDVVLEAGPSGITIQLRRVSEENAAPPISGNPFMRPRLSSVDAAGDEEAE